MNAAIIGYGKMGHEIERLLVERGHTVGLVVDADNRVDLDAAHLRGIDVALEFTTPADDTYLTIEAPAEAIYKEKSSKFLAFAYPVADEEEIRGRLEALRKRYFDATHHCYAWRLGPRGETFRANDDGEP